MKQRFAVLALTLALCVCIVPVCAHSGRTDANGGHHVSATGEYHYHHGYPAHQHPDGVCPYESAQQEASVPVVGADSDPEAELDRIKDKYTAPADEPEWTPKVTYVDPPERDSDWTTTALGFAIAFWPVALWAVIRVIKLAARLFKPKATTEQEPKALPAQADPPGFISPDGFLMDQNCGLGSVPPYTTQAEAAKPVQPQNTVRYYRTKNGKCVHRKYGCCGARIPVDAAQAWRFSPCTKCNGEARRR